MCVLIFAWISLSSLLVPSKMTLKSIQEGQNHLLVSWNPPNPPNGIIINYTVQWREYNVQQYESAFTDELSYKIENLNAEHQYCVRVAAFTKVDRGEFSEEICRNTSVGRRFTLDFISSPVGSLNAKSLALFVSVVVIWFMCHLILEKKK